MMNRPTRTSQPAESQRRNRQGEGIDRNLLAGHAADGCEVVAVINTQHTTEKHDRQGEENRADEESNVRGVAVVKLRGQEMGQHEGAGSDDGIKNAPGPTRPGDSRTGRPPKPPGGSRMRVSGS